MTDDIIVEAETTEEENFEVEPEAPKKEDSGAQKRIRQLVRQRNEAREAASAMASEADVLRNQVGNLMHYSKTAETANLNSDEQLLGDKVKLAKKSFSDAFEAGDKGAIIDAQEAMNDASTDLKLLKVRKAFIEQEASAPQQQAPKQKVQQPDPRAEEWAEDNKWFGANKVMTAAAYAIDGEIREEGIDPVESPDKYYGEVNKRIRKEFPHKFDSAPSQVAQVVAGQSRTPATGKKVKLSQNEVATAKKLGISLENYAAEKAKMSSGDEYTVIGQRGGNDDRKNTARARATAI